MPTRRFADLFPAHSVYADMPAELQRCGGVPVDFVRVTQDAHEAEDPSADEFMVGVLCGPSWGRLEIDYGDGIRVFDTSPPASAYVNPTTTSKRHVLVGYNELLIVSVPFERAALRVGLRHCDRIVVAIYAARARGLMV